MSDSLESIERFTVLSCQNAVNGKNLDRVFTYWNLKIVSIYVYMVLPSPLIHKNQEGCDVEYWLPVLPTKFYIVREHWKHLLLLLVVLAFVDFSMHSKSMVETANTLE